MKLKHTIQQRKINKWIYKCIVTKDIEFELFFFKLNGQGQENAVLNVNLMSKTKKIN